MSPIGFASVLSQQMPHHLTSEHHESRFRLSWHIIMLDNIWCSLAIVHKPNEKDKNLHLPQNSQKDGLPRDTVYNDIYIYMYFFFPTNTGTLNLGFWNENFQARIAGVAWLDVGVPEIWLFFKASYGCFLAGSSWATFKRTFFICESTAGLQHLDWGCLMSQCPYKGFVIKFFSKVLGTEVIWNNSYDHLRVLALSGSLANAEKLTKIQRRSNRMIRNLPTGAGLSQLSWWAQEL